MKNEIQLQDNQQVPLSSSTRMLDKEGPSNGSVAGQTVTIIKSRQHHMDSGWSWVVEAGVFFTLLLFMGVQRSYGLFFVEMQERYHVSASAFALVGGVLSGTFSVVAFFVMTFALKVMSERQCVITGVFLMTSGFTLSSLITSFPVFVFTLGAVTGTSAAFIYGPMFVLLAKYFKKHLTLAQAIANTGVSAGALIMPFVVRTILDEFSFPMGLLVIGGILCHMFVCALLFRPVDQSTLQTPSPSATNLDNLPETLSQTEKGKCVNHSGAEAIDYEVSVIEQSDCRDSDTKHVRKDFLDESDLREELLKQPLRNRTYSESAKGVNTSDVEILKLYRSLQHLPPKETDPGTETLSGSRKQLSFLDKLSTASVNLAVLTTTPESLCASLTALNSITPHQDLEAPILEDAHDLTSALNKENNCCPKNSKLSQFCNAKACKSIPMWALVLFQAFGMITGAVGPAFTPPIAKEKGLSDDEATFLLTLLGGLDVVSRLMPGLVAHFGLLKPHQMVILTLTLQGLLCQFLAFFNSFHAMIGFCVGFGCLSGVFFSMTHAIIMQFMGLEGFSLAFGLVQLFNGAAAAVGYPLIGALKDITGTYVTSFHFLGATEFVSASILVSLPFLCRLQKKLDAKKDGTTAAV